MNVCRLLGFRDFHCGRCDNEVEKRQAVIQAVRQPPYFFFCLTMIFVVHRGSSRDDGVLISDGDEEGNGLQVESADFEQERLGDGLISCWSSINRMDF